MSACTTAAFSVAPSMSPSGCFTPSPSMPIAATSTRSPVTWMPSICTTRRSSFDSICSAEWFHPETIELSDVEFRCSTSGARFNVLSSRLSPLHKFVIQKITRPAPDGQSTAGDDPVSASSQTAIDTAPEHLSLVGPKVGGWLSRLTGRKAVSNPAPRVSKDREAPTAPPVAAHNIEEYNWSGFSCPYCSASGFVSCGGGHLACDGTATLRDGRRFRQCFCGQAGVGGSAALCMMRSARHPPVKLPAARSSPLPRSKAHDACFAKTMRVFRL
jgi:hypothetical protein